MPGAVELTSSTALSEGHVLLPTAPSAQSAICSGGAAARSPVLLVQRPARVVLGDGLGSARDGDADKARDAWSERDG